MSTRSRVRFRCDGQGSGFVFFWGNERRKSMVFQRVVELPNPAMWRGECLEDVRHNKHINKPYAMDIGARERVNKSHSGQPCLSIVAPAKGDPFDGGGGVGWNVSVPPRYIYPADADKDAPGFTVGLVRYPGWRVRTTQNAGTVSRSAVVELRRSNPRPRCLFLVLRWLPSIRC